MDFVRLSSYADNVNSGRMVFSKDMEMSIKNRHVLLVEDIVDTGYSMEFLSKVLDARQPASVSICSLIDKTERRQTEVEVDYPGFVLEKGFIVGYGLDYAERYRELPGIFEVRFEE
jgi:hypoxanthine phosphoribosyltransferase